MDYARSLVWAGETWWYDPSQEYQHAGNWCWYHPTSNGYWIPKAGQGLEMYPRSLNEDFLIGYHPENPFKEGDIVRLKTGTAPIRVDIVSGRYFTGEYVTSGTPVVVRPIKDIVLHEDYNNVNMEEENTMADTKTLYAIKVDKFSTFETVIYAHYLATNSSGQWVMEEKGTGKIHTVDKKDVEEVLPYTIGVQFLSDGGIGKTYSYTAEVGKFSVGDMYILDGKIVIVTEVDTKSKAATKDFNPAVKILTEKV